MNPSIRNPALFQTLNNRKLHNPGTTAAGDHEYLGKYLTSASYCLKLSGSERLKKAIEYTVDKLAQAAKGYLGGLQEADWFVRETTQEDEKKYTWDVWGHDHVMYGLLMAYRVTGNHKALEIVLKAAELILSYFRGKKLSYMRCGFTNMAIGHVFALLYEETGNQPYLAFARRAVEALAVLWRITGGRAIRHFSYVSIAPLAIRRNHAMLCTALGTIMPFAIAISIDNRNILNISSQPPFSGNQKPPRRKPRRLFDE